MLLFRTEHGSHLYGLNHAQSDEDTFEVHSNAPGRKRARNALQTINDADDLLKMDLSTFMLYCAKGVPQALEALWSRSASVDEIENFRFSFSPNYYQTLNTYQRTIKSFTGKANDLNNVKFYRHALRLTLNLADFEREGIFNPRLSIEQIDYLNEASQQWSSSK